nr:MAG TPA: hypothetical protein [Caudoviricetes sp.]
MKKGRIRRNMYSITVGVLVCIILLCYNITPNRIHNYTDVMSAILSLSSITTSLLFASFSLIPALPNSKLLKSLKALKTDKKLLDRLLLAIFGFLFCSVFALSALFFDEKDTSVLSKLIISATGGTLSFSLTEQFKILRILLKALEKM